MPKRLGTAALNDGPLNSACADSPVDKRRVGREATFVGWTCSLGLSGATGASPWQGEVQALFLRHEGYLGAIGAFLKGAEQDSEYGVAVGRGLCWAAASGGGGPLGSDWSGCSC